MQLGESKFVKMDLLEEIENETKKLKKKTNVLPRLESPFYFL